MSKAKKRYDLEKQIIDPSNHKDKIIPIVKIVILLSFFAMIVTAIAINATRDKSENNHKNKNLQGMNLDGAHLRDKDLNGANLMFTYIRDADLRNADLEDAQLNAADMQQSNLSEAFLADAQLRGADLHRAILWGADLRWTKLNWADLTKANLRHADIRYADLRSTIFWGADLYKANLTNCVFSDYRQLVGVINLEYAILDPGVYESALAAGYVPMTDRYKE